MMNKKAYIVIVNQGDIYENFITNEFVTTNKEKAEEWVNKFNRIITENSDRILMYHNDETFDWDKTPLWFNKFDYTNNPIADIREIELKEFK